MEFSLEFTIQGPEGVEKTLSGFATPTPSNPLRTPRNMISRTTNSGFEAEQLCGHCSIVCRQTKEMEAYEKGKFTF
jgi:hypothetical protein